MKIGLIYTSTTPQLIELVEAEIKKELGEVELLVFEDASILAETRETSNVTTGAGARLIRMYMEAVLADAEAILNICSSVGEVADAAQGIGKYLGVPIVRIDEEMCKCAVRRAAEQSGRIGVLATLPTTLIPTKKTIQRVAREMGKQVILEEGLIDAFGADQETFQKLILGKATELKDKVDIILFCQGSMAYCEEYVHEALGLPVVSSPRFGAKALKRALEEKGVI